MVRRETDAEFAGLLGVTDGAVSQWRERQEPLDVDRTEAIARLCDVSFDWLLRGERAPDPAPELFALFLPVHREWVARGGLLKKKGPHPAGIGRQRKLTEQQLDRADDQAAATQSARRATAKGARRRPA